jgi:hypothetical protein
MKKFVFLFAGVLCATAALAQTPAPVTPPTSTYTPNPFTPPVPSAKMHAKTDKAQAQADRAQARAEKKKSKPKKASKVQEAEARFYAQHKGDAAKADPNKVPKYAESNLVPTPDPTPAPPRAAAAPAAAPAVK